MNVTKMQLNEVIRSLQEGEKISRHFTTVDDNYPAASGYSIGTIKCAIIHLQSLSNMIDED